MRKGGWSALLTAVVVVTGCGPRAPASQGSQAAVAPESPPSRGLEPADAPGEARSSASGGEALRTTGPMASQPLPAALDGELSAERELQLTLPKANDPLWDTLRQTRVRIDGRTQAYRASHPPEVRRLAGQRVTLRGYMLPLETATKTAHFLISPYTPVCFFHPPAEPNEVVEVMLQRPIPAGYHLVEVSGTLSLIDDGEKGLFFVIRNGKARVVQRVE